MTKIIRILTLLTVALILSFAIACDDKGAMEQMGEEIDEAAEDMRAGEKTLGNKLDDAVDELRDGAKDAKKKLAGE